MPGCSAASARPTKGCEAMPGGQSTRLVDSGALGLLARLATCQVQAFLQKPAVLENAMSLLHTADNNRAPLRPALNSRLPQANASNSAVIAQFGLIRGGSVVRARLRCSFNPRRSAQSTRAAR